MVLLGGMLALLALHSFAVEPGDPMTGRTPDGNVMHLTRPQAEPKDFWKHQIYQDHISLVDGQNYTLTFWAKASIPLRLGVATKVGQPPWNFFGLEDDAGLTDDWRMFTFHFTANGPVTGQTRLCLWYNVPDAAEVWIADIHLTSATPTDGAPDNLIANGQFNDGWGQWDLSEKAPGFFDAEVIVPSDPGNPIKP